LINGPLDQVEHVLLLLLLHRQSIAKLIKEKKRVRKENQKESNSWNQRN